MRSGIYKVENITQRNLADSFHVSIATINKVIHIVKSWRQYG